MYPLITEDGPIHVSSKGWAAMIRKVYEVHSLRYPTCGSQLSIISFIEEPKTIDRIIHYLKLIFEAERPRPLPHHVPQELLMAAEESREYF